MRLHVLQIAESRHLDEHERRTHLDSPWSSGYHRLLIQPLRRHDRNSISVTLPGGSGHTDELRLRYVA